MSIKSGVLFEIDDNEIFYALSAIRNVGTACRRLSMNRHSTGDRAVLRMFLILPAHRGIGLNKRLLNT